MPAKKNEPDWLWKRVEKTDPNYVKKISGRQYKGDSPSANWLQMRATEVLGPCGHGWGWSVKKESVIEGPVIQVEEKTGSVTRELLHVLTITFWTVIDGERGEYDAIGQTRMLYQSRKGDFIFDEDAPKKSLTDAMTKAMSALGFAGDIFLGRFDDNKYVAKTREEFGGEPSSDTPVRPSGDVSGGQAAPANDDDW